MGRSSWVVVTVLVAVVGCGADPPDNAPTGEVDDELAGRLEGLDLTFFLPDLRGSDVEAVRYDDELPGVDVDFVGLQDAVIDEDWTLAQYAAPPEVEESVCSAINEDNTSSGCDEDAGWAYDDYEGSTTVYVVRDGTLLVARVETEDDATLTSETSEALLDAPEITPEDLARG